jgi:hypothetical protein
MSDIAEFLKWQMTYAIDQIKLADAKMNFIIVINLALLTLLTAKINEVVNIFNSGIGCPIQVLVLILTIAYSFCFIRVIVYIWNTIRPRIYPKEILKNKDYISAIFWGDVAYGSINDFRSIELEKRMDDLYDQVYVNSYIAREKFNNVRGAFNILIPTTIIVFMIIILINI